MYILYKNNNVKKRLTLTSWKNQDTQGLHVKRIVFWHLHMYVTWRGVFLTLIHACMHEHELIILMVGA